MKIDTKNFPPMGLLENVNIDLYIPDGLEPICDEADKSNKLINALIFEGNKNLLTSTKKAEQFISKYTKGCVEEYLKDANKKAFGGAYIDMESSFPSMDLYKFLPIKRKNENSGKDEEFIMCIFMSVQGMNNTIISFGNILFRNYSNGIIEIEPNYLCINEEEQERTKNFMTFLLEFNCFLKYGDKSVKNVQKVYVNQRKEFDGYVIDNRSNHIIQCLCAPKKSSLK